MLINIYIEHYVLAFIIVLLPITYVIFRNFKSFYKMMYLVFIVSVVLTAARIYLDYELLWMISRAGNINQLWLQQNILSALLTPLLLIIESFIIISILFISNNRRFSLLNTDFLR